MYTPRASDWLLLLALVAMWGSSFLLTKIAVSQLPPTVVVAGRIAIAALVLLALVRLQGLALSRSRKLWAYLIAIAIMGNCLPFFLITWGQQRIDSGLAGILMAVMPLAVLVMAHFLVAGERMTTPRVLGFVLGFGGIVVLMGPQALLKLRGEGATLIPQLSVLGGALCYAVASIIARRRPDSDPVVAACGVMLAGTLIMLPVAGGTASPAALNLSVGPALAVLGLGVVCTATATVVYLTVVTRAGPTFLSLINYLIPLWAVLMGMVFLGERPGWNALIALGLILAGIGLTQWRPRQQHVAPEQ